MRKIRDILKKAVLFAALTAVFCPGGMGGSLETLRAEEPCAEVLGRDSYLNIHDAIHYARTGDTVILLKDVKIDHPLTIKDGCEVTLDLNGHTIDRGLKDKPAENEGEVINVYSGGKLTLTDSSKAKTGLITGGHKNTYGGGIYNDGIFHMKGGTISGNTADSGGGGVYNSGEFSKIILSGSAEIYGNVEGGTITNGVLTGGSPSNVCVFGHIEDNYISIKEDIKNKIPIGVTVMDNTSCPVIGVFAKADESYNGGRLTADDAAHFKSDIDGYAPKLNVDGKAELVTGYPLTVIKGTYSGYYAEGVTVKIRPEEPENGKVFLKWKVLEGNVSIADENKDETSFVMPAKAVKVEAVYKDIPKVSAPVFSPAGGTYRSAQNVTITSGTEEADIYYTVDGSDPTRSSTKYKGAVTVSKNTTIKAMAVKTGFSDSDISIAGYTISRESPPDPYNPDPVNPDPVNPDPVDPDPVNPGPEKKPERVPVTDPSVSFYSSPEDNFAPVALGSKDGIGGSIKDLLLDFSGVSASGIDPHSLKMTVLAGSKLKTAARVKDRNSVKTDSGIRAKYNKKDGTVTITCKKDGYAAFEMEDGHSYTVTFKVEKPKPDKNEAKISIGTAPVTKTVKALFGTTITSGKLTILKSKVDGRASVSADCITVNPSEKNTIKLQYQYLNKKYRTNIKVK